MEMFGDQKLQLKTKWKSEFNKQLKKEEKSKREAKKRRAFLKSRRLWGAEEKEKWQWSLLNIIALLLVGTWCSFPKSCWEVTACADSNCKIIQDTAERAKSSLPKIIRSAHNKSWSTWAGKDDCLSNTASCPATCLPRHEHHIQLSTSKERRSGHQTWGIYNGNKTIQVL